MMPFWNIKDDFADFTDFADFADFADFCAVMRIKVNNL
jgi:hypothetical protein